MKRTRHCLYPTLSIFRLRRAMLMYGWLVPFALHFSLAAELGPSPRFIGLEALQSSPLVRKQSTAKTIAVNTLNREEVVNLYKTVYAASEGVASGWSGDVRDCVAGVNSQAYKDATLLRVNYFRAMAGLLGDITFDENKNAKCQKMALMISANRKWSHTPDADWTCYTVDGAEAAGHSNVYLREEGPPAIDGYIDDSGSNNSLVGHRRWILYPPAKSMGSGSIPKGIGRDAANALWVIGDFGSRPAQPAWVAWPPRGYVPYQILPSESGRWSFSYASAKFANASVSMQRNGTTVPLVLEQQANDQGYADNTIVWRPTGVSASRPAADITYTVTISNVAVNGTAQTFTYNVTIIDPTIVPIAPSISTQPQNQTVLAGSRVTFGVIATGATPMRYQWRKAGANITAATNATYTIAAATATSAGAYSVVVSNSAGSATSQTATLTVNASTTAPTITTQPQSLTRTAGQSAAFTVVASGTAPLRYQWRKDGVNISGATSASYAIGNVQSSHAGSYTAVVSNSAGSATSSTATLTVSRIPPNITSQPQSHIAMVGANVAFSVTATGTEPLSYQWRKNGGNLTNGSRISGVNAAALTIASAQTTDSGNYTVIVSNSSGAVTSSSVLLTVNPLSETKLSVRASGNQIILSWSDPAVTLEEADTVTGPWKSVVGGSLSPRLATMSASRKFYRLQKSDERPSNVVPVPNMVWISPGTFAMGSPATEQGRESDEGPQTVVTLTRGFYLGKYEVTQGDYQAIMGNNPSYFEGDLLRPVEQVSWNDAVSYCSKLTQQEKAAGRLPAGYAYRLPTEAEWEYACRAGTTTRFSFGDDLSYTQLAEYAWHKDNSWYSTMPRGSSYEGGGKYYTTHAVGTKLPNRWGLYDMHGNVWEWCLDWLVGSLPGGSVTDPKGANSGSYRVMRGGSWYDTSNYCRPANRNGDWPDNRLVYLGFRPVLAPSQL